METSDQAVTEPRYNSNADSVTFERRDPATGETQTVLRVKPGPLQVPSRRQSLMLPLLGLQAASMQQQAEPPRLPSYARPVVAPSQLPPGESLTRRRKLLAEKRWKQKRR